MKYIVIINGVGRSGKDTFVQLCKGILEPLSIGVHNISSIDPVKKAASILGYSEERKNDQAREFLYDIKMAWVKFNNGPFEYLAKSISEIGEGVFFLHMREVKEIEKFVEAFPETKKLLITRQTDEILLNPSDTQVHNLQYDFNIENNGTLGELKKKAEDFLFKDLGVRVNA